MQTSKRILQLIAVLHIIGGLLLPLIAETSLFNRYHQHLIQVFDITDNDSSAVIQFLFGILGPTIASWGILFLFSIHTAFANPNPTSWWFIILACTIWAGYDSLLSLSYGVYLNAIFNGIVFTCILIPILLVRKAFVNKTT